MRKKKSIYQESFYAILSINPDMKKWMFLESNHAGQFAPTEGGQFKLAEGGLFDRSLQSDNQSSSNSFKNKRTPPAYYFSTKLPFSSKSWRLPSVKQKTPTSRPCKCLILRVGPVGHDHTTP